MAEPPTPIAWPIKTVISHELIRKLGGNVAMGEENFPAKRDEILLTEDIFFKRIRGLKAKV